MKMFEFENPPSDEHGVDRFRFDRKVGDFRVKAPRREEVEQRRVNLDKAFDLKPKGK